MKTYIVEDKIINIKTGETNVYYLGKDGYVHDEIGLDYCDGYTRPCYAQDLIKRQLDNVIEKRLDDNHSIEGGTWLHIYQVIEYIKA